MIANIFKTAIYHHSKKNFLKAKEIYETLLKTNPNNFDILQNYAVLLSQIKEYKKADVVFKKCFFFVIREISEKMQAINKLQFRDNFSANNILKFAHTYFQ